MPKISREKFKVYKNVFDEATLQILFKLSARGHFDELLSPISKGKESNIFSATTKDGDYIIVKIYRVENCNFNRMYDYIKADPRFIRLRKQRRKIIFIWTQREYKNLFRAREAGVNVPKPIAVVDNVLLLDFIGNKNIEPPEVSPQLKDTKVTKKMFDKVITNMKKMHKAGLVHADLSGFNILIKDKEPYFIDFSQATTKESHDYEDFLRRDITNICNFFRKRGFEAEPEALYRRITGKNIKSF